MKQHRGQFETCHHCQSYIRLGESFGQGKAYAGTTRRLHNQAMRRQAKDDAYRSCGMVKVRGNNGGTYWE